MSKREVAAAHEFHMAAQAIEDICDLVAEESVDTESLDRLYNALASYSWTVIRGSLEELAAELRNVAEFLDQGVE